MRDDIDAYVRNRREAETRLSPDLHEDSPVPFTIARSRRESHLSPFDHVCCSLVTHLLNLSISPLCCVMTASP